MAVSPTSMEKQLLRMITNPPPSPAQFCFQFSKAYEQCALTVVPTAVITGRQQIMQATLMPYFAAPLGTPINAIEGIVQSLFNFWIGVVVPGGTVTAFLGGPDLILCLTAALNNPEMPPSLVASALTQCLKAATRLVQYVIPPNAPAFLVVP